ncbi:Activator of Hsp90 ATPase homolog 1-like protein [Thalassolituus maritimus]|uniref:Activator of Hsp90 ATPase homolog 1-like protein n=1 Tax=Thalassolituus maritimus TaxID=484498 RepID=A0A1N7PMX1_9GAMM|nr:SRPBCC domain-containing protein [Thalassolituus maritimus]SIT11928.1 Activator of Hsp90 ATPase homolog 1-like protein [Thalassolituus maritimus]
MQNDIAERSAYNERLMLATPEQIFDAFRDPQKLAAWWGPDGFSNTFHSFDFREGGEWHFIMHGPDGTDYDNQQVFHEIVDNQKIVMEHIPAPHFFLTVTLKSEVNSTLVTWLQTFDDAATWNGLKGFVAGMNEQNLSKLEKVVSDSNEDVTHGE